MRQPEAFTLQGKSNRMGNGWFVFQQQYSRLDLHEGDHFHGVHPERRREALFAHVLERLQRRQARKFPLALILHGRHHFHHVLVAPDGSL